MAREYDDEEVYYVYALMDPRKPCPFQYGKWSFSHEPFYIGKGKGKRVFDHIRDSSHKGGNLEKIAKIDEIGGDNVEPILKVYGVDEKSALDLEMKMVKAIGRLHTGGPLTNRTDGGDGAKGYRVGPRPTFTRPTMSNVVY